MSDLHEGQVGGTLNSDAYMILFKRCALDIIDIMDFAATSFEKGHMTRCAELFREAADKLIDTSEFVGSEFRDVDIKDKPEETT